MKILICTDGSQAAEQAAKLVSRLGLSEKTRITILGVVEENNERDLLKTSMGRIKGALGTQYNLESKIRNGNPIEQILAEAVEYTYDLVAVGGGGQYKDLMHHQLGSTTSKLARKIHTHFLVARTVPDELSRVLVCTGAKAPSVETMRIGGELISKTSASVGLLHVVSPGTLKPGSLNAPLNESPVSAIDPKTREGQLLNHALQQLRDAGAHGEINPRLREGLVVDEVLAEVKEGEYDLMVIGAHYKPGQDRWLGTLLDDVTDQLLNRATCSVLIV
jgi:nucleotide-binding universal stress UspA family protein